MAKGKEAAKFVRFACTLEWANLATPNEMSGKYEFDACGLSPKTIDALEALGIEVKVSEKHPDKGAFVKIRSARPIPAFDTDGDKLDGNNVGNGTKAIVIAGSYDWKFKGKTGTSASCRKLTITDLVEYDGGEPDDSEVEDTL